MRKSSKVFVGMDVHKESIDITVAEAGGEVRRWGQIGGERGALEKAVRKLESQSRKLHFVYEAGPCGFWIQRLIAARGHACWVMSPSLIPKKSGDRIKTDRRDSTNKWGQRKISPAADIAAHGKLTLTLFFSFRFCPAQHELVAGGAFSTGARGRGHLRQ